VNAASNVTDSEESSLDPKREKRPKKSSKLEKRPKKSSKGAKMIEVEPESESESVISKGSSTKKRLVKLNMKNNSALGREVNKKNIKGDLLRAANADIAVEE
jgi:hypothetical protein